LYLDEWINIIISIFWSAVTTNGCAP
jgi:hypothetical protein